MSMCNVYGAEVKIMANGPKNRDSHIYILFFSDRKGVFQLRWLESVFPLVPSTTLGVFLTFCIKPTCFFFFKPLPVNETAQNR